jgi:hypothetical protein
MAYSIISGWYADHQPRNYKVYGDDFVRSVDCFPLWYECVSRFTSPTNILIIDSASPLKPSLPFDPRINWITLKKNYGHGQVAETKLCGWSRCLLGGLMYGYANGDDYTVLVEQGSLFYGERIIERQIEKYPDADIIVPSGNGTPQPIQTGIMIFRTAIAPQFVEAFARINEFDRDFKTERKTVEAAKGLNLALSDLSFGRRRPVDLSAQEYFMRHLNLDELREFAARLGVNQQLIESHSEIFQRREDQNHLKSEEAPRQ